MLFVEEEGHGEVSNLLLGVLVRRNEVDSFEMTEIDVPAEDVYVQELEFSVSDHDHPSCCRVLAHLADIFLLVVSTEVTICFVLASHPR